MRTIDTDGLKRMMDQVDLLPSLKEGDSWSGYAASGNAFLRAH
jgi:hypothetical protein